MKYIDRIFPVLLILPLCAQMAAKSSDDGPARTIEIHALRYSFAPAEITLKKGETVKLRILSDDVTHALLVPALNINETVVKGHPSEITVIPDATGDFQGQCGHFCGEGHGTMLLTVHVKE